MPPKFKECPYNPGSGEPAAPVNPAPFEPEFSRAPIPPVSDARSSAPDSVLAPAPKKVAAKKAAAKKKKP